MLMVIETWLKCDLKSMVHVRRLEGNIFSQDNLGNLIGVKIYENGEPAEVEGGVTGYVIRNDGETVLVTGELEENRASIILPASAYAIVGPVSIVIKVGTTTVGACTGYVYRSSTDSWIDPGHVVPSIDELLAEIANMRIATAAANTAATEASYVDISMSKTGHVLTIVTTDRNNLMNQKTIQEPTARVTKSGETVTFTVSDADGTTSTFINDPSVITMLLADTVPNTVSQIQYDSNGNVSGILHKSGNTTIRADAFVYTDTSITETRTLNTGASLAIAVNLTTLETTTTYTAA